MTATTASPVEQVLSLPLEDQEAVLLALVEKLLVVCEGEGKIPIRTPDGRSLGYLTPPWVEKEQTEAFFAAMTPEERRLMTEPIGPVDWDDSFTREELNQLIQDVFQRGESKSPEPAPAARPADPTRGIER